MSLQNDTAMQKQQHKGEELGREGEGEEEGKPRDQFSFTAGEPLGMEVRAEGKVHINNACNCVWLPIHPLSPLSSGRCCTATVSTGITTIQTHL